jgi:hypothetical protein
MPEIAFVIKSFVIAVLVVICLQVRIGSTTLENHAQEWIHTSSVALYLQEAADGASLMLHNAGHSASEFVARTFGHRATGGFETQRAGRLNFFFKRSPANEQTHNRSNE